MMNLTFRVQIHNITDEYFSDDQYDYTIGWVKQKLQEIADGLGGNLYDVEMK
jgi:hypothetical protein